jgi:hypothetical protein
VIAVEIMDLVFSLDNVIAVLALSENIVILIIGICISILMMRFAATQFLKLINLEPLLVHATYVLILAIGIELILKYFNVEIEEFVQFVISMAIIIGFIFIGQAGRRFGRMQSEKEVIEAPNVDTEPNPIKSGKEEPEETNPDKLSTTSFINTYRRTDLDESSTMSFTNTYRRY